MGLSELEDEFEESCEGGHRVDGERRWERKRKGDGKRNGREMGM